MLEENWTEIFTTFLHNLIIFLHIGSYRLSIKNFFWSLNGNFFSCIVFHTVSPLHEGKFFKATEIPANEFWNLGQTQSLWISSKFSHKLFILYTMGIILPVRNGLVGSISPSKCMLSVCIWGSRMSQHTINHSFGGTDSLLGKWNGLIGEGCERKTSILGSVPCFCKCKSNLHPLQWVVFKLKKVAVDPIKAHIQLFQRKTVMRQNPA